MNYIRITKENIDKEHICCAMSGKQSVAKKEGLRQRFDDGLVFYRSEERGKCFIEYIPAENAWVPRVQEVAKEHGIPFKVIHITDKESAQNVPAPVTTYALFRDGQFLTQSIQSDKKFLALAGLQN